MTIELGQQNERGPLRFLQPPEYNPKEDGAFLSIIALDGKFITLDQMKRAYISMLIHYCRGNLCEVTRVARIGRNTIYRTYLNKGTQNVKTLDGSSPSA